MFVDRQTRDNSDLERSAVETAIRRVTQPSGPGGRAHGDFSSASFGHNSKFGCLSRYSLYERHFHHLINLAWPERSASQVRTLKLRAGRYGPLLTVDQQIEISQRVTVGSDARMRSEKSAASSAACAAALIRDRRRSSSNGSVVSTRPEW